MHDQHGVLLPGVGELLNSSDRVTDGTVHRNQASGFSTQTDCCYYISRTSIVQDMLLMEDFSHRNRCAPGLGKRAMNLAQNSFRAAVRVRPESA
jgi:hypothetical protein